MRKSSLLALAIIVMLSVPGFTETSEEENKGDLFLSAGVYKGIFLGGRAIDPIPNVLLTQFDILKFGAGYEFPLGKGFTTIGLESGFSSGEKFGGNSRIDFIPVLLNGAYTWRLANIFSIGPGVRLGAIFANGSDWSSSRDMANTMFVVGPRLETELRIPVLPLSVYANGGLDAFLSPNFSVLPAVEIGLRFPRGLLRFGSFGKQAVASSSASGTATPPASASVTTPPATTTVTTPPPATATVTTPPPAATVTTPPPAATVTTPPPAATVTTPPPAATVTTPPPAATVTTPPPAATVTTPPPAATVTTPPPAATVTTPPPAATVTTPPPAATVTTPPPAATVTTSPPAATVTTRPPAATVTTPPPASTTVTTPGAGFSSVIQSTRGGTPIGLSRAVYFEPDTSVLINSYWPILQEVGRELAANPSYRVELRAYAAPFKTEEGRFVVSENRARFCRDYFVEQYGISEMRISYEAFGSERAPAHITAEWESYRCVEIILYQP